MKKIGLISVVFALLHLSSCSESNKENTVQSAEVNHFSQVLSEVDSLVSIVDNDGLILDSTLINNLSDLFQLKITNNEYRSTQKMGNISLNRIFEAKENKVTKVHFDFYYDSVSEKIIKDADSILSHLTSKLGAYTQTYNGVALKTYSWTLKETSFDYEVFQNGYTITLRKVKSIDKIEVKKEGLAPQFALIKELLSAISAKKVELKNSTKESINEFHPSGLMEKNGQLKFTETYKDSLLLSAIFIFDEEGLMAGLYFDYKYANDNIDLILEDSKITKKMITEVLGEPTEVATVAISTSFEWEKIPISLEIYSDGFSIIYEIKPEA